MPKSFVKRVILFFGLAILFAFVLQWILVRGLLNYDTSSRGVWNRVVRGEVNADLLVCGSSRGQTHYDAQILSKETGLSTYNVGRNGTPMDLQLGFLKTYLAHNRAPKYVVQNLDVFCFLTSKRVYEPWQYIPYLNEPIYDGLVAIDPGYARMRKVPLLGIIEHRLFLTALGGLLGITQEEDHFYGYKPEDLAWTGEFEKYQQRNPKGIVMKMEAKGIEVFIELLELCAKSKIKLILVYSPEYREGQKLFNNREEVFTKIRQIADSYGVEFIDYSADPICDDRSLFYNSQHLNRRGATLFSEKLGKRLRVVTTNVSTSH